MNFLSQIKMLPSLLMNNNSSVFLASDSVMSSFLSTDNIITRLLRVVVQLFYFSCKWVMYMVDVIYFYILQLAGIDASVTIVDSARSDMTFNLLLDNTDTVTQIIKNLVVIALILIIVTAIIAIIRQQALSLKEKKAKKSPTGDVMKSVLKSVILIILTPLVAILGIVASSVILQSLFNATNLSSAKSLSARVFNASASAANKYRLYAENGVRIPIKYKFSDEHKEEAIEYAVEMIGNEKFPNLIYFDVSQGFNNSEFTDPVTGDIVTSGGSKSATDAWLNNTYYKYFDTGDKYSQVENTPESYKIMQTHKNEYYAMSDVISYALDTMEPLYFVTIQELLESLPVIDGTFDSVIENPSLRIQLLRSNGDVIGDGSPTYTADVSNAFAAGNYAYIRYTTYYGGKAYTYVHVKDEVDEMEGAKFVVAYQKEKLHDDVNTINGDYYDDGGTLRKAEKYFYKDGSRYKKADLYYYYNTDREEYVKAPTYGESGVTYYYKIGEDYYELTSDKADKFYYKEYDGDYVSLTLGQTFHSTYSELYYMPLVGGVAVGDNNPSFSSEYIANGNIITARGLFDKSSYPTAIRRTNDGDLLFYRDDLELVANGSVSDVGTMDQIEVEEESTEDQNFFQKAGSAIKSAFNAVKKFVTDLFNPLKLVPDLRLDSSAMSTTYTNKTSEVFVLKEGKLHLSYFFADSLTSSLSSKMYGMDLNCLFDALSINYVILLVGTAMFLKIMVTSIFQFIDRGFKVFMLILIYPVACATIPLDDASGAGNNGAYSRWSKSYTKLLFSTYGLILGINFVFIILPVIDELVFFTPENFVENKALSRLGNALFRPWTLLGIQSVPFDPINYSVIADFLNKILRIMFQIAAFSLITKTKGGGETYTDVINTVVGVGGGFDKNPLDNVVNMLKTAAQVVNVAIFPQKAIATAAKKILTEASGAIDFIPGSAVIKEAGTKLKNASDKLKKDAATKALTSALDSHASQAVVEAALEEYRNANDF